MASEINYYCNNKRSKDCNFCEKEIGNKGEIIDHDKKKVKSIVEKFQISEYGEKDSLSCNFCEKKFKTKGDYMHHKKRDHIDHVENCWNFISGICEFDENSCWFRHSSKNDETNSRDFKCIICDQIFLTKNHFMKHRKEVHENLIPKCKNQSNGKYQYGKDKCWFRHSNDEKDNQEYDKNLGDENVIQRLFKIIEEMSQRIVKIENKK